MIAWQGLRMGDVHQQIREHGHREARHHAADRVVVDSAFRVMVDDTLQASFLYSGFCLLALPHQRVYATDPQTGTKMPTKFGRDWGQNRLEIEPGYLPGRTNQQLWDVPYGSLARLVLLYLQTEAVKSQSPRIEVGPSMRAWLHRLGVSTGGKSYRDLKKHMLRFNAARMTFLWPEDAGKLGFQRVNLIRSGVLVPDGGKDAEPELQGRLWADEVELDPDFYTALKKHPVPVQEAAVRELNNSSLALDIYVWLAYRLHALQEPMRVSWRALHEQFGSTYRDLRMFRRRFKRPLELALSVYEDANVFPDDDRGLILYPSRPPVPYLGA